MDDLEWSRLSGEDRAAITRASFQGLLARVEAAFEAGTFDARDDRHLTWIAMKLDEQGWSEMRIALRAAFSEVEQIRADAERRLADSGGEPIPSTYAILGFESPAAPDRPPPSG